MKELPFISVIVPTYNRDTHLRTCLESLLGLDYPADRYEIIVCDNNSTDRTSEVVEACKASSIVPLTYLFEQRQGVHFARNSAARTAKGEVLYFTDDDIIADPLMLRELVRVLDPDPMIGCVTGRVLPKFLSQPPGWVEKHLINYCLSLTDDRGAELLIGSFEEFGVYSCHQAIRREVFFRAGGFNPENTAGVWAGDGEAGLNIKISKLGYKFAYTAGSVIYHVIPESRTTLRYLLQRMVNEGYCNSCTEYRRHRRKSGIVSGMAKRNLIRLPLSLFKEAAKVILGRQTWRFVPAKLCYFHGRNVYDLKLLRDDKFRRLVEIDDWLKADGAENKGTDQEERK